MRKAEAALAFDDQGMVAERTEPWGANGLTVGLTLSWPEGFRAPTGAGMADAEPLFGHRDPPPNPGALPVRHSRPAAERSGRCLKTASLSTLAAGRHGRIRAARQQVWASLFRCRSSICIASSFTNSMNNWFRA